MLRLIAALVAVACSGSVAVALSAGAMTYGDAEACLSGYLDDTGAPSFFDGQSIFGQDWSCDLSGRCEGEGETWTMSFTVQQRPDSVLITYEDGNAYTLKACE